MARLRVGLVLLVLALTTLVLLPLQLVAIRFSASLAGRIPMWWQRVAAFCLGLKVTIQGAPASERPLLILSNHVSWLDIVTLGSVLPVSFIAKSEVGTWPVVKWLARLQRSVFIDRTRRGSAPASNEAIAARLVAGDAIVLFAEGTTDDGISVLPFRSALVGAARHATGPDAEVVVQPVAIVYTALQGLAIGRQRMADVAWHGDMDLAPHLTGLICVGSIDAVVVFGTPIAFGPETDRKVVAAAAEAEVRRMVRAVRAGRNRPPVPPPTAPAPILSVTESG
ncbi:1-acyl-sn-glycerol-3-phosphate acyltransferase [Kaistia algarum]|uniref:lysophospholipid acyltransferase family protein n=1 Tax=Kaistia algarum TaxID=2083279 RepID=UPI000CE8191E|nr:lysophospholipid acyltransferase family protein [Kaistia algarum]MCX5513797.1 lysophospholipid acyltransferase family protein [Kaistia algarum]PPE79337.1 1-acyl-sn-glycerol-3-phosphate acyltransferase [Kaistia algarum]